MLSSQWDPDKAGDEKTFSGSMTSFAPFVSCKVELSRDTTVVEEASLGW